MRIMTVAFALGTALVLCDVGTLLPQPKRGQPKWFANRGSGLSSGCPW